jgi:hypothetical protein
MFKRLHIAVSERDILKNPSKNDLIGFVKRLDHAQNSLSDKGTELRFLLDNSGNFYFASADVYTHRDIMDKIDFHPWEIEGSDAKVGSIYDYHLKTIRGQNMKPWVEENFDSIPAKEYENFKGFPQLKKSPQFKVVNTPSPQDMILLLLRTGIR